MKMYAFYQLSAHKPTKQFQLSTWKQSSNTVQWIITGLEQNIVSDLGKYYDLLKSNS